MIPFHECWEWVGAQGKSGYGRVGYARGKMLGPHQASLMLHGVDIPKGMVVDHICKNHSCVNPKHLRVVTPRFNTVENSVGITAVNARKTHCIRGHEFTPDNLVKTKNKHRGCRTCTNLKSKAWRKKVGYSHGKRKMKVLLTASLLLSSCCHSMGSRPPRDIEVYSIKPNSSYCDGAWCQGKVGLVRKQAHEVLPFSQAEDYLAVSPEDFKRVLDRCPK